MLASTVRLLLGIISCPLFRLRNVLTVCQQYPLQANTESDVGKILKATTTSRTGARSQRVDQQVLATPMMENTMDCLRSHCA